MPRRAPVLPRDHSIPAKALPQFRRRLLDWFFEKKRDLDWRRTRDPYRIWISEIMLQQTRVAAVLPYYRCFLETFPTANHLARAPLDAVLRCWSGLGYYSRARYLHRAAQEIVARHGGTFPENFADALALPGIGVYTASAVLSMAYDVPLAVLDGNVARVLARLGAMRGDPRRPANWRRLAKQAGRLLAPSSPGDSNQALMELGATVCTPQSPRCAECPVARWCRARKLGLAERVPPPRRKPPSVRITLAATVLLDPRGRTLLVRREDSEGALFSRLWQFPGVSIGPEDARHAARPGGRAPGTEPGALTHALAQLLGGTLGIPSATLTPLPAARHTVTFREIRLLPYLARVERLPALPGSRTPRLDAIGRLPVSSAARKIAAAALNALRS